MGKRVANKRGPWGARTRVRLGWRKKKALAEKQWIADRLSQMDKAKQWV